MAKLLKLLKGKQEHRDEAFAFVYLHNKSNCFQKAIRFGITADGFEDIYSDTFMRFVDAVLKKAQIKDVHAYLKKVFKNRLIDEMKQNKKNPEKEGLTGKEPEPEPDVRLSEKAVENIWQTMQKLSPKCREYLVLHHMEGKNLKEIASEFDTKPEIIKTELNRCRKKFRKLYNFDINE